MSDFDDDFGDDEETGTAATSDGKPRPNSKSDEKPHAYNVTADELRQFVERIEQLEAEKKDVADQIKEVKSEAKGRGYDLKALNKIVAERKRDANALAEEEAICEIYRAALGMI